MLAIISKKEVKKHNNDKSLWIIIYDEIYDITSFIKEHPGGPQFLIDKGGNDDTVLYEEIGHSVAANEMLKDYRIGVLPENERKVKEIAKAYEPYSRGDRTTAFSSTLSYSLPLFFMATLIFICRLFDND
ncbi:hypothetical protein SNEBB_003185 [Seison nebaliae]|nr:hypothetical protein SNEBB_003185 [Seison nebaliae]